MTDIQISDNSYYAPEIQLIQMQTFSFCQTSNLSEDDNNHGSGHNFDWDD